MIPARQLKNNETEFPSLEMTWDQKTPFPIDPYHQSNKPFVSPTVYMYPGLFNEEAVSAVQTWRHTVVPAKALTKDAFRESLWLDKADAWG